MHAACAKEVGGKTLKTVQQGTVIVLDSVLQWRIKYGSKQSKRCIFKQISERQPKGHAFRLSLYLKKDYRRSWTKKRPGRMRKKR